MNKTRIAQLYVLGALLFASMLTYSSVAQTSGDTEDADKITVARLSYGNNKKAKCFNDAFLAEVDRKSTIKVKRSFDDVLLSDKSVFNYPLLVMNGEKTFKLTEAEEKHLLQYLQRGGFIIASAGCASNAWDKAFRATLTKLLPKNEIKPITTKHPLFKTLFDVTEIQTVKAYEDPLHGIYHNGKLIGIYAEIGLNDSASMAAHCCCCGGNEIKNARQINANILVYLLTN